MTAREDDLFVRRLRGFLEAVARRAARRRSTSWWATRAGTRRKSARPCCAPPPGCVGERQQASRPRRSRPGCATRPRHRGRGALRRASWTGSEQVSTHRRPRPGIALMVGSGALLFSQPAGRGGARPGGAARRIGGGIAWATRRAPESGPLIRLRAGPRRPARLRRAGGPPLRAAARGRRPTCGRWWPSWRCWSSAWSTTAPSGPGRRGAGGARGPGRAGGAPGGPRLLGHRGARRPSTPSCGSLDEGTLVRALAASEARGETRARRLELLEGLERLRTLEEQRGRHLSGLLEAASLLERAVQPRPRRRRPRRHLRTRDPPGARLAGVTAGQRPRATIRRCPRGSCRRSRLVPRLPGSFLARVIRVHPAAAAQAARGGRPPSRAVAGGGDLRRRSGAGRGADAVLGPAHQRRRLARPELPVAPAAPAGADPAARAERAAAVAHRDPGQRRRRPRPRPGGARPAARTGLLAARGDPGRGLPAHARRAGQLAGGLHAAAAGHRRGAGALVRRHRQPPARGRHPPALRDRPRHAQPHATHATTASRCGGGGPTSPSTSWARCWASSTPACASWR